MDRASLLSDERAECKRSKILYRSVVLGIPDQGEREEELRLGRRRLGKCPTARQLARSAEAYLRSSSAPYRLTLSPRTAHITAASVGWSCVICHSRPLGNRCGTRATT